MVLTISTRNKNMEFSVSEVKLYSGVEANNIPFDNIEKLEVSFDRLKSNILRILQNYTIGKIEFIDKKIYNHIKFYKHLGIKLDIKLESISKSKYKTRIYYKNTLIHTCHKDIEVYFNYLVLEMFEKSPEFSYLFDTDTGLFDENKIIIDHSTKRSNERFDMKIELNGVEKSFGLECFENHHYDKFDIDYRYEVSRILNLKNFQKDIRFVGIFWFNDIIDKNKFSIKFTKIIKDNFISHNKTKKEYCVEELNKSVGNKKLCEIIYDSYKSKTEAIITISTINENFAFMKNGKKKYLKHFIDDLENRYNSSNTNEYEIEDFDLETYSDTETNEEVETNTDISTDKSSQLELKNNFMKKYIDNGKLTFDGLAEYLIGLGYGDFLAKVSDKFKVRDWFKNILYDLMKSFENAYDDLDKLAYGKNIFGLNDNEIEQI